MCRCGFWAVPVVLAAATAVVEVAAVSSRACGSGSSRRHGGRRGPRPLNPSFLSEVQDLGVPVSQRGRLQLALKLWA